MPAQLNISQIPLVHELPGVGQNFQDHVGFLGLLTEVPEDAVVDINNAEALHQWLIGNSGETPHVPSNSFE